MRIVTTQQQGVLKVRGEEATFTNNRVALSLPTENITTQRSIENLLTDGDFDVHTTLKISHDMEKGYPSKGSRDISLVLHSIRKLSESRMTNGEFNTRGNVHTAKHGGHT